MFKELIQKVKDNKATVIKAGSAVAGALVGALIANAVFNAQEEPFMIEEGFEGYDEAIE